MKSTLRLPFLLLVCCLSTLSDGASDVTESWYETKMNETVIPAYKDVYTILQQSILNSLLANANTKDNSAVSELVSNLTCSVESLYNSVGTAVNESQKLRSEIDQKVEDAAAAVSAKEGEINGKEGEIQQKTAEIQGIQTQLSTAEQGLRDKQQNLANAENALRIAENELEEARRCHLGRKRRDWWSDRVGDIVGPICSVLNYDGINTAKDARNNAQSQVTSAQQQVDSYRQQLSSIQGQKTDLDTQLSQLQAQLQALQSTLLTLREESNTVATIDYELKRAIGHIKGIWDASAVLFTTIKNLINFDLLISPLNAIYDELTQSNLLMNMPVGIISNSTLIKVKQSVDKLAKVLPKLPFNTLLHDANCENTKQ
ncbi:unnamed protein product [Didymodactylos carnosus]|uniref:Uncharacterized protein n=1 Tax=Didymodactylos carnosus TaxID=1234261 RepID=A0A8S2FX36_9BILA|nr:unnamed protein product [Didymodactylos carnosus]CAF4378319.1 unnamed protein product [Didymodactylos carnosus]